MLEVTELSKRFGNTLALDRLSLVIPEPVVLGVLGPSGCGKTTLLRAIAGLEQPDAGRVTWNGEDLAGVPPHKRGFGLMFQDYALFPHRDVSRNVAFGLEMAGQTQAQIHRRVAEVLELVGLTGFDRRRITTLSGGEAQRVALARALAPSPRLLMLDEPLGSLDRNLAERLMGELKQLLDTVGITSIYVTHDQEEALAVSGRLAVMRAGQIAQAGTPEEVWGHPANAWVASFLGLTNLVEAEVADGVAHTPWGPLQLTESVAKGTYQVLVRPEALIPDQGGGLEGKVESFTFRGDHFLARITPARGPSLEARLTVRPRSGETLRFRVDPARVQPLAE